MQSCFCSVLKVSYQYDSEVLRIFRNEYVKSLNVKYKLKKKKKKIKFPSNYSIILALFTIDQVKLV